MSVANAKEVKEFTELCINAKNPRLITLLFNLFFTHEELENLSLRVSIVSELIKKEKTQREIAKHLNVSIAKISRGSNELKRTDKKLLAYLESHLHCK
ncbi:MAG: Trp operon repressor [Gammaproteobacteria bacterium RIFCSPHIGHO2_12_FULL_41_20]|nr:MAG: Trp operon repressor [Gammaproteobacteria bacterium RIFCSPHIGHO2_12_FULL_41_20]